MVESDSNLFRSNMALLRQYHPQLVDIVSVHRKKDLVSRVVLSANRKLNIQAETAEGSPVLIHEPANPGGEAESFLSMVPKDSTGVVLMFGMGLGYSALALARRRKKLQAIVIFELNTEFFIHGLGQLDFSDLLLDTRVRLRIGQIKDIAPVLGPIQSTLMLENIHTLSLTTCFKVNAGYAELSSVVFDYVNALNAEGNTKTMYGEAFIRNRLRHLTSISHDRKLEELAGAFQGKPAIIVAAGPSLDKNIHEIANAQENAIIISADTALPTLLKQGVVPDFVTAIDYKELTYEKIAGTAADGRCREISLICTSWVTHKVTKVFPAKSIFWAFSANALENWMNRLIGGSVLIPGAGTVAHLNFISADVMGCAPIIFVGQDLSFTDEKGHASNVTLSSRHHTKQLLDAPEGVMSVKGWDGNPVTTNRQMHSYRCGFEKMIKRVRAEVINATEGGAFIEGAIHMPLIEAISKFCTRPFERTLPARGPHPGFIRAVEKTLKKVATLERIIKKADKLGAIVMAKLPKFKDTVPRPQSLSDLPENLQKKILDLDDCHQNADNNALWEIFNEMTMDGVRENEREKHEIQAMDGVPEKYLEWLIKSIVRVNRVNQIRMKNLLWFKKEISTLLNFLKKENSVLAIDGQDRKRTVQLAELYLETGNYVLLDRLLENHGQELKNSFFSYYQGVIGLHRGQYGKADSLFKSAMDSDKGLENSISQERVKLADEYLNIAVAQSTAVFRSHAIVMMLLGKGLACCPDHGRIKAEIRNRFEKTLAEAKNACDSKDRGKQRELLEQVEEWVETIENNYLIAGVLGKKSLMDLNQSAAVLLTGAGDYQKAMVAYRKALSAGGENPAILVSMTDICFTQQDFETGIKYLKAAVNLDKQYAVYWYNMGKNLQVQKDFEGAVLAFEQYFIALPENVSALKDMGDCYKAMGNSEAASEAYKQFRRLSPKNGSEPG